MAKNKPKAKSKHATSAKRPHKPFKGKEDGVPFSKENQPSPEQKSMGWQKKKALKDLLNLPLEGEESKARREELLGYLGLPKDLILTVEEFLHLKMFVLQLKTNNNTTVQAYEKIMNRAYGHKVEITGKDGQPLFKVYKGIDPNKV